MAGNQYQPDPRQSEFLKNYLDPKSDTFSNALRSGLKAGYTEEYSKTITSQLPDWLSDSIKDEHLVNLAEKALSEALSYSTVDGEGKVDAGAGRLKLDASKLVLKGMRKDKYSERVEQTGKDGAALPTPIISLNVQRNDITEEDNSAE